MPLPVPADDGVRFVLQTVWDQLAAGEHWPTYEVVDRVLHRRHRLDVDQVLRRTSEQLLLGGRGQGLAAPADGDQLRLTIAGAAACRGTERAVQTSFMGIRLAARIEEEDRISEEAPALSADQLIEGASDGGSRRATPEAARLARQVGLLLLFEPWTGSSSLYEGGWRIEVTRRVRRYADVPDLETYWARRTEVLPGERPVPPSQNSRSVPFDPVTPFQATEELVKLRDQAASPEVQRDGADHDAWKAKVDVVMATSLGPESPTLEKFRALNYSVGVWTGGPGEAEADARYFASQVDRASGLIDAAIYELGLRSPADPAPPAEVGAQAATREGPVFVVHGRDDARKYELVRLLERTTDRGAVVLHEQPNRGGTILEKLERHAQDAGFAVVLLTGDDEGRLSNGMAPLQARGRQNVILELGVFLGLLGRSRVAVLTDPDVERPSDLDGLVYITLDPGGAWKLHLVKELEAVGIRVDHSRIP